MFAKKYVLILFVLVFLAACSSSGFVCNKPYIAVGDSCCLDKDDNKICDKDEQEAVVCEDQVLDCSQCAPTIVTQTEVQESVKILCKDGITLADSIDECAALIDPEPQFTPITTNEDDQILLEDFTVRPACRSGFNGLEIYFKVGSTPKAILFQTKDAEDASYSTAYTTTATITEKYLYGVFCTSKCTTNADFFLDPDQVYLFRGLFDYKDTSWETIAYSNEHIIDASEDGEYATKLC